ncbi:glycosyltransferase [Candidatus Woesearchaeota archaeon]|nr:glycosyltransferase [Candidatus Woesearchaeota archaeon]
MRIAIFTDSYYPYTCGVTTAVDNQARALTEKGHDVLLFCPGYKDLKQSNKKNMEIVGLPMTYALPFYRGLDLTFPTAIKSIGYIQKFKPEIIHSQTEGGVGWEGQICAKVFRTPIISTIHTFFGDPGYLKHLRLDKSRIAQKMVWSYSVIFHNRSDLVICPSNSMKAGAIEHGLKKQVKIISNGIDLSEIQSNSVGKNIKGKYGLGEINLLYFGRISVEKSIDVLIEAFRVVLLSFPQTKLVIIGDGPYFRKLKSRIKEYQLDNNVVLTGRIQHEKLINSGIIKACDIFISASKTENQPVSVMEAMAFGLPLVGVKKLGMAELIADKVNGFLCTPDDPVDIAKNIIEMIKDKNLREQMGFNSLKLIREHSLETTINQLTRTYTNILNKRKKIKKTKSIKYRYKKLRKRIDERLQYQKLEKRFIKFRRRYVNLFKKKN